MFNNSFDFNIFQASTRCSTWVFSAWFSLNLILYGAFVSVNSNKGAWYGKMHTRAKMVFTSLLNAFLLLQAIRLHTCKKYFIFSRFQLETKSVIREKCYILFLFYYQTKICAYMKTFFDREHFNTLNRLHIEQ